MSLTQQNGQVRASVLETNKGERARADVCSVWQTTSEREIKEQQAVIYLCAGPKLASQQCI